MQTRKKGRIMANLSKLAKAFMLPIALLPIAGLFLGVGTTIVGQFREFSNFWWFGRVLRMIGNIPFQNLPALFAISIAIAFTKDAGVAGLTAFLAWLVFNVFISLYMREGQTQWKIMADFELNWYRYPNNGSNVLNLPNTNFQDYTFRMDNNGYLPPYNTSSVNARGYGPSHIGMKNILASQLSAEYDTTIYPDDITLFQAKSVVKEPMFYNLWFWRGDIGVTPSMVQPILGIGARNFGVGEFGGSLNTGVFGGIAVGGLVAFIYNRFYKLQLPKFISFFGGVRSVPIITFIAIMPLAAAFIIIWPGFGNLLIRLGKWSSTLPSGLDSFIFGVAKRSLIPFGLHHVFYAPMWWSSAGGQLNEFIRPELVKEAATLSAQGDQTGIMAVLADGKIKLQDVWASGLHLGRFQSGEFAMMMFALPGIAIAMWLTIPRENRRAALGIYFSAALTSFLTGITEPIEFTFLFVAPFLYYFVHVPIFASSYMVANIMEIKVGMTFSGGMLDWLIFGVIPSFDGHETRWWWVPIIGSGYALVEAIIFYIIIKKFNIMIPGREATEFRLFTKSDFRNKGSTQKSQLPQENERTQAIIKALGTMKNLENVDACATRLRVTVFNPKKVNVAKLKSLGAVAVVVNDKSIQAIFGGEADVIKTNINEMKNNPPISKIIKKEAT